MSPEQKLAELKLELPPVPAPGGIYKPVLLVNNLAIVSGQPPLRPDGSLIKGKVGLDLSLEQGQAAARQTGLTMLSTLKNELGSLNKIKRLVKTLGMVNSTPDFGEHPLVINGFSQLMVDVFGPDKGKGARSAVGMMLPFNIAVEIEAMFELED
jgi:enamine deaminase RidA (YjgF/YER057c/UK114 family)